jgi:hypothetical protein
MATRLYLVAGADDGELYSIHQTAPNGSWSAWQSLGKPPGERLMQPTLSASKDGRLELFGFSTVNAGMWHRWQTAQYGGWHAWIRVPDPPGVRWDEFSLTVRAGGDGRLQMFCVKGTERPTPLNQPANDVWHRWQTSVNGSWSSWITHGQPPHAEQLWLNLAMNTNGRLDLLCGVATEGTATEEFHTWHLPQDAPNGTWSSWQQLPDLSDPHTPFFFVTNARNQDGRLEAFGLNEATHTAWEMFQNTPGGSWHSWVSRGNPSGRPLDGYPLRVAANGDGRLELFGLSSDGVDTDHAEIWHMWQTAPNNGWSSWHSTGAPGGGIGPDVSGLAVGSSADGRLELFALGSDDNLWHRWQTAPNNG